jgi:hypothetical protein
MGVFMIWVFSGLALAIILTKVFSKKSNKPRFTARKDGIGG